MTHLPDATLTEIERLDGTLTEHSGPTHIKGIVVPPALQQWLYGINWPERTYANSDDSPVWVWLLQFGMTFYVEPDEFPIANRHERPLVCFGMADGGNYLLAVDLSDTQPHNPQVYAIDHYDPEQQIYPRMRLLDFLMSLQVE